ncbi:hypothetical protein Micbo1qcDRAFT_178247 [Microdochium bolleyi]|uniref:Uncharacterized protein n=1 Tax=Microdochium bolleyi TaxID=196109 RepID=A0A136IT30_9PEZI|nr:hypothetical protein Micbo1qcDRAFT_178247 [Microdochium bolleyi]
MPRPVPSPPYQDSLVQALDALSPADIIQSQRLLSSFTNFLARGSTHDVSALLHAAGRAAHRSQNAGISASQDKSARASTPHGPSTNRSSSSTVSENVLDPITTPKDIQLSARKGSGGSIGNMSLLQTEDPLRMASIFFRARVPTKQRIIGLLRVTEGILKAPKHPASFYRDLWSRQSPDIWTSGSGCSIATSTKSRLSRLFRGMKIIERESDRFASATRLSLMFLAHDIDVIKDQDWELDQGQSRQNAAVQFVARQLAVDPGEIKKEWRRGRNYMKLLMTFGPASLLELGNGVNW